MLRESKAGGLKEHTRCMKKGARGGSSQGIVQMREGTVKLKQLRTLSQPEKRNRGEGRKGVGSTSPEN